MKKFLIGVMILIVAGTAYSIFSIDNEPVETTTNLFEMTMEEAQLILDQATSGTVIYTGDFTVTTGLELDIIDTMPTISTVSKSIPAYKGKLDMENTLSARLQDYDTAIITAKFSDDFINNYKYEDSDKFFFGLKVFVGGRTDNGGYYNALRTRSLSVANWEYLTGVVMASQLKDGFTWTIPLNKDIYIANSEFVEGRQVVKTNLSQYFNEEGDTKIGAYLSSTKELKGWELGDIEITLSK